MKVLGMCRTCCGSVTYRRCEWIGGLLHEECLDCLGSGIRVREYFARGQLLEAWRAEIDETIKRFGRECDEIRMRAFTDSKPKHAPRARKR